MSTSRYQLSLWPDSQEFAESQRRISGAIAELREYTLAILNNTVHFELDTWHSLMYCVECALEAAGEALNTWPGDVDAPN